MTLTDRLLEALRGAGGPLSTAALCRALDAPVGAVLRALDELWVAERIEGGWPSDNGPWWIARGVQVQMALGEAG